MSEEWRNDPATEKQKAKLRFFRCTWDEGITKGQASDAIDECVEKFPDWEFMYQNRPATEEQKALLRSYGKRPLHNLTYARAREKINECEGIGWQKDISKSVARWEKQNPPESGDEHFENALLSGPAQPARLEMMTSGRTWWQVLLSVLAWILKAALALIGAVVVVAATVLVKLIFSSGKSRHRRR